MIWLKISQISPTISSPVRQGTRRIKCLLWLLATVISIKCSKLKIDHSCALLKSGSDAENLEHLVNPRLPKIFVMNVRTTKMPGNESRRPGGFSGNDTEMHKPHIIPADDRWRSKLHFVFSVYIWRPIIMLSRRHFTILVALPFQIMKYVLSRIFESIYTNFITF